MTGSTLTRALEGSGMQSAAAERIATEIYDAIHDNVATKGDVDALGRDLRTETAIVRSDLRTEMAIVRSQLAIAVRDLKIWSGSVMLAVATLVGGALFTALRLWPPH